MSIQDIEGGYTKMPNTIIDSILSADLTCSQQGLVFAILRYTYGFNREKTELSTSFLAKAIGNKARNTIYALNVLIEKNIVLLSHNELTKTKILSINTDVTKWNTANATECTMQHNALCNTMHTTTAPHCISTTAPHCIQEIKTINKNNKENIYCSFFDELWKLYPYKIGKSRVSKKTIKKLYDIGYEKIANCIEQYKANKPDWQNWQNGSTFFNSGYIDYLDETNSTPFEKTPEQERLDSINEIARNESCSIEKATELFDEWQESLKRRGDENVV